MRLSSKIILLILSLAILFGVASASLVSWLMQQRLVASQNEWVNTLMLAVAEGISEDTIEGDAIHARELLQTLVASDLAIEYAYVVDFEGRIFSHSFEGGIPRQFVTLDHQQHRHEVMNRVYSSSRGDILDISHPLVKGMAAMVHVGINQREVQQLVRATVIDILSISALITLLGVLLATLLGRRITAPLNGLAQRIRDYGGGKSDGEMEVDGADLEVAQLVYAFNEMTQERNRLEESKRKSELELEQHRQHLQELVEERTRDLVLARDEALAATRTKSEFLANMSHELRTPLNSIIGFTGLVKDGIAGPVNEEQKNQLGMVYDSSTHLLGLINDILDLSKVEAGKHELVIEQIFLVPLCEEVIALLQPQADAKAIVLQLETAMAPEKIDTDRGKLRQVLVNLVGNAIKFTEQGAVTLRCRQHGKQVVLEVSDSGIGIDQAHHEKIFDAFRQVDQSDTRKQQGTGLGLAICEKYIALMGGRISLQSAPGEGSTFRVELPLRMRDSVSISEKDSRSA